jgi:predicted phage-related endonuclease
VRRSGTWRSIARPWQIANPDRLLYGADGDVAIYEGKTAHAMHADTWGRPGTDNIPVYYRTQTLWYLDTFGYTTCHLAVLIGGSDYREYIVRYDAAEAELMRTFGAEFMASLAANDRPPIDESDSTYQAVRSLNPHIEDRHKEVPEDIAVRYITACGVERDAKAAKQRASSELLDAMGAARYAVHQGQRIAMRAVKGDNTPYLRAIQLKE